jgi:enamine deaminase RidA (YjgF/YER057c/UK114 family)
LDCRETHDEEAQVTGSTRQVEAIVPTAVERYAERWSYSPGVVVPAGDLLFVSGQVGRAADGTVVADPAEQFATAFANLASILEQGGATLADVVDLTTYHTSMADLALFAEVKSRHLTAAPYPAWTAIGVQELALPGLRVEIKATARLAGPTGA